eukprot:scaffold13313_cov126-Isochrysis_galbana.AAC.6
MAPRQLRLWSPPRWFRPRTKMLNASASTAPTRALHRPLRESQHPPLLPQLRLSTTIPSGVFQISPEFPTDSFYLQASIHSPTAAELAGEDQEVRVIDTQPQKTGEYMLMRPARYARPITIT